MSVGPGDSGHAFKATCLVSECPAAYLSGTMPVRLM